MSNILEICNLNKKIDDKVILSDLSLAIQKGKIVGFLGPNGSGKTTTLKIIAGLLNYDSGDIKFCDKNFSTTKKGEIIFIPDNPLVYEELTGYEYLNFIKDLFNINYKKEELDYLISSLDFKESIYKEIRSYSLGMKKKVALIGVLLIRPKLLLLDEYISGIDPINLFSIKKILRKFVESGNSIFISTHQLEIAERFCDTIISINNGKILDSSIDMEKILSENSSLENYFISKFNGSDCNEYENYK